MMSHSPKLQTLRIDHSAGISRAVPSDVAVLSAAFFEQYDNETLFYDLIDLGQCHYCLVAPPLYNLRPVLDTMLTKCAPSIRVSVRHRHAYDEIYLTVPPADDTSFRRNLTEKFNLQPSSIDPSLFSGRRVLFTQNKNNNLEWLQYWMAFHHKHHGADALMLFDNNSDRYSLDTLRSTLLDQPGFASVRIVGSDHRYMPSAATCTNMHSCLFLQSALMRIARLRWLSHAASILSCDIDELVIHDEGKSVFQAAEKSWFGAEVFNGAWTYPFGQAGDVKHDDHKFIRLSDPISRSKYCYRPRSYMGRGELHVHTVHGAMRNQFLNQMKKTSAFQYLHCTGISTYRNERFPTSLPDFAIEPRFERILNIAV